MIDRLKNALKKDRLITTIISLGIAAIGFGVMFMNTSSENITAFGTGLAIFAVGLGGAFYNFREVKPIDS